MSTEDVWQFEDCDIEVFIGEAHRDIFLISAGADVGMVLGKFKLRPDLVREAEIGAQNNSMLDTAFFGDRQKTSHGVDIVLLVKVVDGCRAFDTLIDTGGEHKSVHTLEVSADLIVAHFKIVAVLDLHLRRKDCPLRERRKGDGRHLVATFDEFFGGLGTEQSGPADHKYLHLSYLLEIVYCFCYHHIRHSVDFTISR